MKKTHQMNYTTKVYCPNFKILKDIAKISFFFVRLKTMLFILKKKQFLLSNFSLKQLTLSKNLVI